MAKKRGNPNIREVAKGTYFTSERARECALKSVEAKRKKANIFANVRPMVDFCVAAEKLNQSIVDFWEARNVPKECITPVLADITPTFAEAIANHDWSTLHDIYKFLGLSFESTKEQNVKLAFENKLGVEASGELVINFVEKQPEPIE